MLPLTPLTPAYPYPFPPPPSARRANTLLLKHRLVDLLTPEQGEAYWTLLCSLLTAKITREEFGLGWATHLREAELALGDDGQLQYLHNALLLSILYNTTKPTLPPASVSHQGWNSKRKRGLLLDGDGTDDPAADPLGEQARKRRRVKKLVQGMTKGEKKRLKLLLNNKKGDGDFLSVQGGSTVPTGLGMDTAEKTRLGLMPASAGLKPPNSAALQQELQRVSTAPSCVEARELPDINTMNERMSAVAYSSGLSGGVDMEASGQASVALNAYLKDILSALLSLVPVASTNGTRDFSGSPKKTITKEHLSALLELSPSLLHSTHLGSVERFLAHQHLYDLPPPQVRVQQLEQRWKEKSATQAAEKRESKKKGQGMVKLEGEDTAVGKSKDFAIDLDEVPPAAEKDEKSARGDIVTVETPTSNSLMAELFPELPAAKPASPKKNKAAQLEEMDTASSDDDRELNELLAAEAKKQKKQAKEAKEKDKEEDKKDRGRFGTWKLLAGILDAHGPASVGHPQHALLQQQYGVQRGHQYRRSIL